MLILKVYFISFIPFILSESFKVCTAESKAGVFPALSIAGLLRCPSLPVTNRFINPHHARTVFHICLNQGIPILFAHILLLKYDPLFQHKRKARNTLKSISEILFLIRRIWFFPVQCELSLRFKTICINMESFLFTSVCCANPGSCVKEVSTPSGVTRWSHLAPLEQSVSSEGQPQLIHTWSTLAGTSVLLLLLLPTAPGHLYLEKRHGISPSAQPLIQALASLPRSSRSNHLNEGESIMLYEVSSGSQKMIGSGLKSFALLQRVSINDEIYGYNPLLSECHLYVFMFPARSAKYQVLLLSVQC